MIFYQLSTDTDGIIGCELSKTNALHTIKEQGYVRSEVTITKLYVDVTAETIRLLLGNLGGYAKKI